MSTSEIQNLINEFITMSTNDMEPHDSENRNVYLSNHKDRTREIGQRLHDLSGYELMLNAHDFVPDFDQAELTCAWDGIGEWQW